MKEKLIIKNFGPIKDVVLELGKFTVLIGEQATGKSTVAKLLAVCRYFSYLVNHGGDGWFEHNFLLGLKDWGLEEALQVETYISYRCEHYEFTCEAKLVTPAENDIKQWITVHTQLEEFSEDFSSLMQEYQRVSKNLGIRNSPLELFLPTSFFQNDVARVLDNPFYIPAERGLQSIFSLGKSSIQNISDSLFNQLANLDRIAREFKSETLIEPLNIVYKNVDGRGYIKKLNEDKFYSLFNAATGFKSTIPIVLTNKYYTDIRRKTKTLIVEEPEQNLHPSAQQNLINYLVANAINKGNSLLVTTQSPYVLTSLNNLIYAHKVANENRKDVNELVEEKNWLNGNDVTVYMLLPNGKCENIVDEESGLIEAEKIDGISRVLNREFDLLQDIELGLGEEK